MTARSPLRITAIVVGLILATLPCLPATAFAQALFDDPVSSAIDRMSQAAGAPVKTSRSAVTGLVTFMSTPAAPIRVALPATADAEARARVFLRAHGQAFGIGASADAAHLRSRGPDLVGTEHVRFQQLHGGVPVTGGEIMIHLRGADVVGVNAKILDLPEPVDTNPTVSADEALAAAETVIADRFGLPGIVFSGPRLEVFSRGMLEARRAPVHLAWFVEARRIDVRQFIWIDAHTGMRLLDFSQITDALNRSIYNTNGSNALPGTLVRSEGGAATGDGDADAAYNFSGDTYNYYRTQHGLDSYDGAGAALISTVHYCPSNNSCNYQNAFWNGTQMVYGNGFSAADDADAHELTHAVTEHSANLYYYMQSGALNESFSDIFGETVDLLNGAGTDTAAVRWLIGEDIPGIGAIRNMMDPTTVYNDPGKMSDTAQFNCAAPGNDGGGVHTNSGVPNHAYALMVDGGTYNGFTITGIGLIKAGKIEYRALTTYLLSGSDFLDNYDALKQSCSDLVGTVGITAADCVEVGKALDAVEMANPWPCSPPQAAVPLFCPAGQVPENVFFDNLENTASGNWAITTLSGITHWFYPASFSFATSGVRNLFGYDQPAVGDSAIGMTTGVAIPAGARLQFNHAYGFDNNFGANRDGGVIEYSTDGGATWLDAGTLITAGAVYGGAIVSGNDNPLAGRNAFVGDSFGYTASQLDLSSLSGQNVQFRFRMGTGNGIDDYGWFIDDIRVYTCEVPDPQPFRDVRRPGDINLGADLGGTGETAINFTGGAGPAGDTWITVYDTDPNDATPTLLTGSVSLSADVLIHRYNNAKGAGLLALYNEGPGKKGLALIVFDNGNSDRLILATVDQAGRLTALKGVSLGAGIVEDGWYHVTMDVGVSGKSVGVTGRVFRYTVNQDLTSGLGPQVGPTLIFGGVRPEGIDVTGEVGIIASAASAVVDASVTNFVKTP